MRVTFRKSINPKKKLNAIFYLPNDRTKIVSFGAVGYSDYTIHKDPERQKRYITRHQKHESWTNLMSPGALSRYVLWEYPNLEMTKREYKKKVARL